MSVHLVRHAKAGDREAWKGPDDLRPLSKPGRQQAEAIADRLVSAGITCIISSPSVRCRQTIQPLADRLRLPVELDSCLAEGAPVDGAMRLLEKVLGEEAVLCTHGDVLPALLQRLAASGVPLEGTRVEKASEWVLAVEDGHMIRSARHVPAPVITSR